jgi:hypothetical protein
MEPQYQTVAQMYARLQLMICQHNDTGFRHAIAEAVLQPRNPFEPKKKRYPKQAVSIGISVFLVLTLIFLYFSLHPGRLAR